MDYEFKANLTTVLCFVLLPVLTGFGVDNVTGVAFVGLLATVLCYVLLFFNERYLSRFFTLTPDVDKVVDVSDEDEVGVASDADEVGVASDADEVVDVSDVGVSSGGLESIDLDDEGA